MTVSDSDLPQDLGACHALIAQLEEAQRQQAQVIEQLQATVEQQRAALDQRQATIDQQQATIDELQATIERLTADLALLKRALFGSRRERFIDDPRQTFLFASIDLNAASASPAPEEAEPPAAPQTRRTSRGRSRRVFPDFFPRTPVRHTLDDEDIPESLRNNPNAQRFFKKTSEQLEYEPPSIYVIEHFQEVIVLNVETGETTMVTAPKPPQLIEAFTGPGFWAYLTASRFADHLPYYRQEDILSRYGFRIDRSTQWRWMFALAEGVRPLVDLMRSLTMQSRVLGMDETPVTMLGSGLKGSRKAYLWDAIGDRDHPYDCFYFTVDRSRDGPAKFLSGFRGYLQSDAYICYELISAANEEILKTGCWAHARRKFEEVHFTAPSVRTHMAMAYIQRLYDIEDRGHDLSDEQRYELRQREAKPIVEEFHRWLVAQHEQELPKSKFRAAIGYMINRWEAFERYLECGAIPFDNNRAEAALKYAILGRKAWLFVGNERAGETAAILFTLTKSCNRHRVDPVAYLRDVYTRLPTMPLSQLESLLPDRWIKEHPEHMIQERVDEAQQRAARTRQRRAQRRQLAGS